MYIKNANQYLSNQLILIKNKIIMYNLFKSHFRSLIAVLLAFVFLSATASAKNHYSLYKPGLRYSTGYHYDFTFVMPVATELPSVAVADYFYPVNDAKPDNINYQLVKQNSIGLLNSHRNY